MNKRNYLKPPTGVLSTSREYWYSFLNSFPFVFLPLVAIIGLLCSLIMPYLTGVNGR